VAVDVSQCVRFNGVDDATPRTSCNDDNDDDVFSRSSWVVVVDVWWLWLLTQAVSRQHDDAQRHIF